MRNDSISANWLELVEQSDKTKYEDGNELAKLWTCNEYNIDETQDADTKSAEDPESVQTPTTKELSSPSDSSIESNLLMLMIPD